MSEAVDNTAVSRRKYDHIKLVKETSVKPTPLDVLVSEQKHIDLHRNDYIRLALDKAGDNAPAENLYWQVLALEEAKQYIERRFEQMMESNNAQS